jgi:hypothetical protein
VRAERSERRFSKMVSNRALASWRFKSSLSVHQYRCLDGAIERRRWPWRSRNPSRAKRALMTGRGIPALSTGDPWPQPAQNSFALAFTGAFGLTIWLGSAPGRNPLIVSSQRMRRRVREGAQCFLSDASWAATSGNEYTGGAKCSSWPGGLVDGHEPDCHRPAGTDRFGRPSN